MTRARRRRDPRYRHLAPSDVPATECLRDTVRTRAAILEGFDCALRSARSSGHRRGARQLVARADQVPRRISDDDIVGLNIPTARPLVYELDADLKPLRHYYLGDAEEIARATAAVAAQGKSRPGA